MAYEGDIIEGSYDYYEYEPEGIDGMDGEDADDGYDGYDDDFQTKNLRVYDEEEKRTIKKMTSYEYARMIGSRAKMIDGKSPVGIEVGRVGNDSSSISIAVKEAKEGKMPILIVRPHVNGFEEVWDSNELEKIDLGLEKLRPTPVQSIKNMSIDEMIGGVNMLPKIRENRDMKRRQRKQRSSQVGRSSSKSEVEDLSEDDSE